MDITQRSFEFESTEGPKSQKVTGLAAVYSRYDMGAFTEEIAHEAWGDLKRFDIRALVNHDKNKILARSKQGEGSLKVWSEGGLKYSFDLPDTTTGRDTKEMISRGDINQSSWQFVVARDKWDFSGAKPHRTIMEVADVRDVSLVTFPANPDTTAELRSMNAAKDELTKQKNIMTDAEKKEIQQAAVRDHVAAEKVKTDAEAAKAKKFIDESHVQRGASQKELRDFSKFNPHKMLKELLEGKFTGVEAEINQEGIKEARSMNQNVITIKPAFHLPEQKQFEHRQQTVTGGTAGDEGGILVAEEFNQWVNFLYPDTPVLNLCTKFDNLVGDQLFPVEDTVPTLQWGTEIATTTSQESLFSTIPSSPERARIMMGYSNRLLAQEHSRGLQNRLTNQMNGAFNTGLEETLIAGLGTSSQPTGIMVANVGNELVTGTLTHDKLIAFELALANADALGGKLAYITDQTVRAWLKSILLDAGSGQFLASQTRLNELMTSNGYPVYATTAFPLYNVGTTHGMIFGNFDDVSLNMWGAPIIMTNPYSRMDESVVEIYAERQMDVTVHRLASFATADDIVNV